MRPTFIALMIGLPAVGVILSVVAMAHLKGFLKRVPRLATRAHLEEFKRVAALQMYLALAALPILITPGILYGVGFFSDAFGLLDLPYVIVPSLVVIGMSKVVKGSEQAVQTIETADEGLRRERERVVETWMHKPLPDW